MENFSFCFVNRFCFYYCFNQMKKVKKVDYFSFSDLNKIKQNSVSEKKNDEKKTVLNRIFN